jgi:hypothetical protein
MKATHTKGPWVLDDAVDREGGVPILSGGHRVATAHMRADTGGEQGSGDTEQLANAHLIAAASDLLVVAQLIRLAPLQHGIE